MPKPKTWKKSVWQIDVHRAGIAAQKQGFTPEETKRALALYRVFLDVARGVQPPEVWVKASADVRGQRWFKWLGFPPRTTANGKRTSRSLKAFD